MKFLRLGVSAYSAVAVAAALVAACGGNGDDNDSVSAQQACTSLAGMTTAAAKVTAAAVVAASGPVPTYCKVSAKIEPALNLEVRIPDAWNGKLHYGGGGGFNGFIQQIYDAAGGGSTDFDNHGLNLAALKQGYINVASDGGHAGKIPGAAGGLDASWVPGNPAAERQYADLAVPTVLSTALEMIKVAYGTAPTKSYFEGCSNGGREGLISAQRFPNLFDGIVSRAPALNYASSVGAFATNIKGILLNPSLNFTPAKVALLSNAVRTACDGQDGVVDGIVSNPAACTFTAATARATLRCAGGADTGNTCLSDAQLAVVDTWTAPRTFAGKYLNPGWALTGNEDAPGNWDAWLFAPAAAGAPAGSGAAQYLFAYGGVSGFLLRNPATAPLAFLDPMGATTLSYDFDAPANASALAAVSSSLDATDPDLRPFMNRGAKLLLWHGGTDPALTLRGTTAYYQSVVAKVGGQASADAFVRYYIAPGVNHCRGGPGADKSDLLAALDAWVTNGTAPGNLSAAKLAADGSTTYTRPLCRYPQYPRYTGPAGDANAAKLAASYTCTTPP